MEPATNEDGDELKGLLRAALQHCYLADSPVSEWRLNQLDCAVKAFRGGWLHRAQHCVYLAFEPQHKIATESLGSFLAADKKKVEFKTLMREVAH